MADAPSIARAISAPTEFSRHWAERNRAPCPAVVRSVRDGDTIVCEVRSPFWPWVGRPVIRVSDVDCPETALSRAKGGPLEVELGLKAKAFTTGAVLGQSITVAAGVPEIDDYGRFPGAVVYRDPDGTHRVLADELTARRLTKAHVAAYVAATPAERDAWGLT